jgi:hypothetical protein
MTYRIAADLLVLFHFAFILFVVLGGFLVFYRHLFAWLHLPAVIWGALIEFSGWICPLTPWEQTLRIKAGQSGYSGGFVEHYIVSLIYPSALTPEIQIILGASVLVLNVSVYVCLWSKTHGRVMSR